MPRSEKPLISVIIPAYNAARCLGRAVRSVQAQTEQDFEIIIIDDASTDDTVEVAQALAAEDTRITFISMERNGGPSAARNRGFDAARGDWVAILDADDAYKPSRLATLCRLAEARGLDAIGDDLIYYDELAETEVKRGDYVRQNDLGPITLDRYLESTTYHVGLLEAVYREDRLISLLKLVIRRDFLERTQLRYSTEYRYCEDFLFYYDLLYRGGKLGLHDEPLYIYTEQLGSISRAASPHSRTVANRGSIIAAVDAVLARDKDLTPRQRTLLEIRKRSVGSIMRYEAFRKTFREGQKARFFILLAGHRDVWFHFVREVRHAMTAKIRSQMHSKQA